MTTSSLGLLTYAALTFCLSWSAWALVKRSGLTPEDSTRFQLAILPGACAPAAAAALVRWAITRQGFQAQEFIPQVSTAWPYYIAGLLAPALVALSSYGLTRVFGLDRHCDGARSVSSRLSFLLTLPLVAIVTAPLQFGEEFGWRAFFQAELFPSWPLVAAVVAGLVWAVWHLPLIRMGYGYPTERWKGFGAFSLHLVLLSIFLGWIHARTGDVWAVSLAHMANNAIGASTLGALLPGRDKRHIIGYEGLISAVPLGIICLMIVLTGGLAR